MKPPASSHEDGAATPGGDADGAPGVPIFRTWGGVYAFVFGCFVLMVVLLAVFTRVYR